ASLEHGDEKVVRQAVTSIRALNVADFDDALGRLATDDKRPVGLRVAALTAVAPRLTKLDGPSFDFLIKCLKDESTPLLPLSAAEAISKAKLDDAQLRALTPAIAAAGALELPNLLAGFERSKDAEVGKQLIAALEKSPGFQGLSAGGLERVLRNYPEDVRQAALPLLKKLSLDFEAQKAKLEELQAGLRGGDPGRGKSVFAGKKTACIACHAVNGEGAKIGPDLSKIGAIRTPRDLLEAVVFPSASFVRGYEPFVVETRAGQIHSGIILRDSAEDIFLLTPERAELRIRRSDIETIARGKVSVMPQGLDTQMTRAELADLIAFLQSLK
ncbi:MAG: c-type cytochrome, partial [Gemmataceae bacterium]